MPTLRKQYFGIRFPFSSDNLNGFFLDLNVDLKDKVASEIAHVILTPKGSRLRKPEFGTDLIKYIFEQNDDVTWDDVRREAIDSVSRYIRDTELEDINVFQETENEHAIYLDIHYKIKKGMVYENNRVVIKL